MLSRNLSSIVAKVNISIENQTFASHLGISLHLIPTMSCDDDIGKDWADRLNVSFGKLHQFLATQTSSSWETDSDDLCTKTKSTPGKKKKNKRKNKQRRTDTIFTTDTSIVTDNRRESENKKTWHFVPEEISLIQKEMKLTRKVFVHAMSDMKELLHVIL